ncbi:hypothetical protein CEUSTIGMA_g7464.t1 [Chlamydomonas eustigma]|uniref:Uncharacterized protein n=1 Tax=Chlamydomonas eustigma TaxID=1157962 RepID=A0A250XA96_9CHLO|nr:hypothetical protein CEUSTIGMA_g7464.t1 [Chlamydomonas eustigma]|eukprot:GAX80025.1 hypothetical protein CEUSTIGMA_g7464.t1 [Chlamydomonas eustigma]
MSKPALSTRVQGMKFMQRAKEKQVLAEVDRRYQEQQEASNTAIKIEDVDVPQPSTATIDQNMNQRGCKILYEGNPQASVLGRFVFTAGKSSLQPAEKKQLADAHTAEAAQEAPISDVDMARAFMRGPAVDARKTEDNVARKKARNR